MSDIKFKLEMACICSCQCLTKTPEAEWHDEGCRYRTLREAINHIAMLEKDVERYQWVKQNADIVLHEESKFSCDFERYTIYGRMPCCAEIDSAIDYGMSTQSTDQKNVSIKPENIDTSNK